MEYVKHVYKQKKTRLCVVCEEPNKNPETGEEILHYIHIEAKDAKKCELYVEGLKAIMNYMAELAKN